MIPCMQMRALRTRLVVSYNLVPCTMYFCEVPGTYEHERCFSAGFRDGKKSEIHE
jgi:hypothetical protein